MCSEVVGNVVVGLLRCVEDGMLEVNDVVGPLVDGSQ